MRAVGSGCEAPALSISEVALATACVPRVTVLLLAVYCTASSSKRSMRLACRVTMAEALISNIWPTSACAAVTQPPPPWLASPTWATSSAVCVSAAETLMA